MERLFNGTPNNEEAEENTNNQLVQRINQLEELLNTVANSQYASPNPPPPPVGKQRSHKVEAPNSFTGNPMTLHRWINQVETYFHLTRMTDDVDQVKMISLLVSGKASIWWEDCKDKYSTWLQAKNAFLDYYKEHHVRDIAYEKMMDLRQTKDVLSYLTEMDRLNAYVKLSDLQMVDFISHGIKPSLYEDMKHYKDMRNDPDKWRHKLIEMDTSSKKSSNSAFNSASSSLAPKSAAKQYRKDKISKEQMNKRKEDKRCLKCGRSNHMIKDCRNRQYRHTPEPYDRRKSNTNGKIEEPPTKKARTSQSGQIQLISTEDRIIEIPKFESKND